MLRVQGDATGKVYGRFHDRLERCVQRTQLCDLPASRTGAAGTVA